MAQHYQKWVTETVKWCPQCGRETRHSVSDGRLAHCLEHTAKGNERGENKIQQQRRERRERDNQNRRLFE